MVRVLTFLSLPVPWQLVQILSNVEPVPWHVGQEVFDRNEPNIVLCCLVTVPDPLQSGQVCILKPPCPWHSEHSSSVSTFISLLAPLTASSKVILIRYSKSLPSSLLELVLVPDEDEPKPKFLNKSPKISSIPPKSKPSNPEKPPWELVNAACPYWSYCFLFVSSDNTA